MSEILDTVIIGGGLIGVAVARELARSGREVFVIEKNPGITQGENQSSRNSGVIHAGLYYDQATRPLKAALCARGAELLYDFCREHQVRHLNCGKLILATRPEQVPALELYLERARVNKVPARLISGTEAGELEPGCRAIAALHAPSSGVIDPTALLQRLHAHGAAAGAEYLTATGLVAAKPIAQGLELTIRYRDGASDRFAARQVVNCAGLYSDVVAAMVSPDSPQRIDPMRGEAACFYHAKRPELAFAGMNLYPTPYKVSLPGGDYWTVGVHLTPTLEPGPDGQARLGEAVMVGPLNFAARHKEDFGGMRHGMHEFWEAARDFFPGLRESDLMPYQAGVQARLSGHQDWVVARDPKCPALLNLLGIDSPGLTACLALARLARSILDEPPA